jgi:Flp pilus assembly protein TadB
MRRRELHLSRPVYEGLPWAYILGGIALLVASYVYRETKWSAVVAVFGIVAVVGGIVVLLRRRDFRELRSQYENPDSSLDD